MVLQINTYYTVPFTLSTAKRLLFPETNGTDEEKAPQTSIASNSFKSLKSYPFVN